MNQGSANPNWHGGRTTNGKQGYPLIWMPEHPNSYRKGYIFEHIVLAEKALGKLLPPGAVVHHANGTTNSGPLVICENKAYHILLHRREKAYKICGHASWRKCKYCKQYDDPKKMYVYLGTGAYHYQCSKDYHRSLYEKRVRRAQARE